MSTLLLNHAEQPCNRLLEWPQYVRATRSGPTITNEQQRELLSRLLPGKWILASEREDQLITENLEPNGWRFDSKLDAGVLEYRLVWRHRLIAYRLLRSLSKGDV